MRIAYVTSKLPYGHGETFIIPELNDLISNAHDVKIVPMSPRGPVLHKSAEPLLRHTVRQDLISGIILGGAISEFVRSPMRSIRAFGLILKSRNPAILARNLAVYGKGLWLAGHLRKWGADHIHSHWANTPSTLALIASEVSGIPFSVTAHRGDITDNNLLALKLQSARFTRFISEDGIAMAKSLNVFDEKTREVVMLHMGIALPHKRITSAHAERTQTTILCAAHLIPRKGHRYLLDALSLLCKRGFDVTLDLAGDGPEQTALQEHASALGLGERVRFLGLVSHSDLMQRYAEGKVDIVVLPTLHEGIPVSLMEAMSFEIPVISTTTGGIPELLQGGAGILVPAEDASALCNAMARLLGDKGKAACIAKAGRVRVEQEYDVCQVGSRLRGHFLASVRSNDSPSLEDVSASIR